jgi:hypothetical protein
MRNDYKLKAVKRKFQHKGYAVWIMMLEVLASSDYFEYEWTELNKELLSSDFDLDIEELDEIIDYFLKLKLIQFTEGYLHCERLTERLMEYLAKNRDGFNIKNAKRYSVNPNKTTNTDSLPMGNPNETTNTDSLPQVNEDSKEKESKLNQTKRNESEVKDSKQQETGVKETEVQETDDNWEVGIRNSLAAK